MVGAAHFGVGDGGFFERREGAAEVFDLEEDIGELAGVGEVLFVIEGGEDVEEVIF